MKSRYPCVYRRGAGLTPRHASSLPRTRFAATAALRERPVSDCPAVDPCDRQGRAIYLAATATTMQAQLFGLTRL